MRTARRLRNVQTSDKTQEAGEPENRAGDRQGLGLAERGLISAHPRGGGMPWHWHCQSTEVLVCLLLPTAALQHGLPPIRRLPGETRMF